MLCVCVSCYMSVLLFICFVLKPKARLIFDKARKTLAHVSGLILASVPNLGVWALANAGLY